MRILFIIPARSGSKGVANKSIRILNGRPLLHYVIDAIRKSKSFSAHECCIFLNTDSEHYATIARKGGAETPFLRPKELATDSASVEAVVEHTVQFFNERNSPYDLIVLIQPTSPFLRPKDIDATINLFLGSEVVETVSSVTSAAVNPLWCNTLDSSRSMEDFIPASIRQKNRQELPDYYQITGSIRAMRWNYFERRGCDWYGENSKAVVIPMSNSLDIDTEEDFKYAEFLISQQGVEMK